MVWKQGAGAHRGRRKSTIPWTCLLTSSETLPCSDNTEQQRAELSSIHKRTLTKLKASSNLACLPQQRQRCPLFGENIKTWLRTSMSHRRRTHLALTHVHGDVLDKSHSRKLATSTTKGAVRSIRKFIKISNQIVFCKFHCILLMHTPLYHLGHLYRLLQHHLEAVFAPRW